MKKSSSARAARLTPGLPMKPRRRKAPLVGLDAGAVSCGPVGAEDGDEPLRADSPGHPALRRLVVHGQGEADVGPGEAGEEQDVAEVRRLGRLGAEKFPARGQVEEKRADFDLRAGGEADFVDVASLPPSMIEFGAGQRVGLARAQTEARDGGDARDGLAAKAVGGDAVEIVAVAELAGGVAFEAEERVVLAHAAAVVGDGDEAAPARADLDVDWVAPASSEFSSSSLSTEAGRSMTSPAAIWLATCSGRRRMRFICRKGYLTEDRNGRRFNTNGRQEKDKFYLDLLHPSDQFR